MTKLKVQRGGATWLERLLWPAYYFVQCESTKKYLCSDGSMGWGTCFKSRRAAEEAIRLASEKDSKTEGVICDHC